MDNINEKLFEIAKQAVGEKTIFAVSIWNNEIVDVQNLNNISSSEEIADSLPDDNLTQIKIFDARVLFVDARKNFNCILTHSTMEEQGFPVELPPIKSILTNNAEENVKGVIAEVLEENDETGKLGPRYVSIREDDTFYIYDRVKGEFVEKVTGSDENETEKTVNKILDKCNNGENNV